MTDSPHCDRRVLVIDDNPAIHEDFRKIFARQTVDFHLVEAETALFAPPAAQPAAVLSFELSTACAGEEGVRMVREARSAGRPYAVAFVDVRMPPGWDGIETLAHLWHADPHVQAVLCTAHSDHAWDEITTKLGQTDRLLILKKPFDNIEVYQLAYALTEKRLLARQARVTTEELSRLVEERTAALACANERLEREINERARAEAELRHSEQCYRGAHAETERLLGAFSSILIELDEQQRVTRWNRVAEAAFSTAAAQAVGSNLAQCVSVTDCEHILAAASACRADGRPIRLDDLRFRRVDGQMGFLGLTVNPVADSGAAPTHVLIVGQDITERKWLQAQLAQSQKLESIGQLAAGIAHEINTPTQFVGDNTRFLQDAFRDLLELVSRFRELWNGGRLVEIADPAVHAVEVALEKIELDYLAEEIPKAIQQSLEGIERVTTIVRAMKDFSHPNEEERKDADLNKAVTSTITVARNEWKYVAEVVTDLDPRLPLVPCFPGDINQVILNLLVNAAHAIGEVVGQGSGEKGVIRVSTRQAGDWVELRIQDTGAGIPEAIRSRIFEPFFTTKEVGKGTGQGLAIAHNVVAKKHAGSIAFDTAVGTGTTFIIRLPLSAAGAAKGDSLESAAHPDR